MNKQIFVFAFVDSIITLAFILFGLNVLWSFAEAGEGILGLAIILGATSVFKASLALVRGYLVDSFQKKITIIVSLVICGVLCALWVAFGHFLLLAVVVYIAIEFAKEVYGNSYATLVAEKLKIDEYVMYDSISIMAGRMITIIGNLVSAVAITLLPQKIIVIMVIITLSIGTVVCHKLLPKSNIDNSTGKEAGKISSGWIFAKENVFRSKKVLTFIVIVFLLNLDYAFIPTLLPMFIITATELTSPLLFGIIRAGNNVGELVASAITLKFSKYVSRLTKIGLGGSVLVFALFPFTYTAPTVIVILFALYSFFDMLTQPLYSYFVSSLPSEKRGRILGIVDSVILMASPFGILLGVILSSLGMIIMSAGIVTVFVTSLLIVCKSESYSSVRLD